MLENTRYEKLVILHCVEGWQATILWEAVLIRDVLAPAAINDSGVTVIFHAHDGYTTSLPMTTIMEKDILLAYKANGALLPARLGSLHRRSRGKVGVQVGPVGGGDRDIR